MLALICSFMLEGLFCYFHPALLSQLHRAMSNLNYSAINLLFCHFCGTFREIPHFPTELLLHAYSLCAGIRQNYKNRRCHTHR
jgi:hypothetical protein